LSKIDLIESYGKARCGSFPFFPVLRIMLSWLKILSTYHKCLSMCAAFNLDFYTDAQYILIIFAAPSRSGSSCC
jgi:hypothetical protein